MSDQALKIVTLLGSLRKGSYNAMVARALPGLAPQGVTIEALPSIRDIPLYDADMQQGEGFPAAVEAIAEQIRQADGVIIVTPEYNYSVPGGLKTPSIGCLAYRISRWPASRWPFKPAQWGRSAARAANTICVRSWCSSMRW